VDYLRRESRLHILHSRHAAQFAASIPASGNPGHQAAERKELVLAQIRRLSLPEQQVLLLRLQEGLSYREISHVTGRTEGNVGCLLHQAVRKLSRLVGPGKPRE
jgi:RNA polymerase sigma-70 factor (ECF subfamily)